MRTAVVTKAVVAEADEAIKAAVEVVVAAAVATITRRRITLRRNGRNCHMTIVKEFERNAIKRASQAEVTSVALQT
jgi:hypothetical protein